jgi:hypothetical protein
MVQLHKRFTDSQVKELIERYLNREIERGHILGIAKTRFFALVNAYRNSPHEFSLQYRRSTRTRAIPQAVEVNIVNELQIEKNMIKNPDILLKHYNYNYIRDLLASKYHQNGSLTTVIDRATKHGFSSREEAQEQWS